MSNEKIRQRSQVRPSDIYDDTLPAGATLETGAAHVEDDLNAVRSQIKRLGNMANWYDTPIAPDTNTDETVKVSANDLTAGYLFEKIIAGANITVLEVDDGGAETLVISGSAAGVQVVFSATPPVSPTPDLFWWDTEGGNLYVWYEDGDSAQWVIAIQVTDGVNLVPVEDNGVYAGGPKTFDLSDTPYTNFINVFVNGVRIDKTDWSIAGTTLTILGDLETGDEVTFTFFISDEGVEEVLPAFVPTQTAIATSVFAVPFENYTPIDDFSAGASYTTV